MNSLPAKRGAWWGGALDSYHRNTTLLCPFTEAIPRKHQRVQVQRVCVLLSHCPKQSASRKGWRPATLAIGELNPMGLFLSVCAPTCVDD